jgi:hypothetical protein
MNLVLLKSIKGHNDKAMGKMTRGIKMMNGEKMTRW